MGCYENKNCGGCVFRNLTISDYRLKKEESVRALLEQNLGDLRNIWQKPVFIDDGTRRRASFAFELKKGVFKLGFNENKSHEIIDIKHCFALTEEINTVLPALKDFLQKFCAIKEVKRTKGKKFSNYQILSGDILVLSAQNGIDIVLESAEELTLDHRLLISEFVATEKNIIRFSYRSKHTALAETIVQKIKPYVIIGQTPVFVSAGDFLQASEEGEKALLNLVLEYIEDVQGNMADLFCGIGTFSYALSKLPKTHVTAADISPALLENFQKSTNAQMIQNIKIVKQNLFLYPMEANELENFDVIVFDPPRAGAIEQVREICKTKVSKIIAVSCNIKTFARDAKLLLSAGFILKKLTMVDQFVYSDHSEVVALFTNQK